MQKTSDLIWQDTQHQVLFELIDKIKEGIMGLIDETQYICRTTEITE